jgi:hypothetical protein
MIPKGLFSQIAMILLAVGIIITYIQPVFDGISETQDAIASYKEQREKVKSVNDLLATYVTKIDNVTSNELERLSNYMPSKIDDIDIQRDLLLISNEAGVFYLDASYQGVENRKSSSDDEVSQVAHKFDLSVEGSYDQLKNLFKLIQQNHYPLEVYSMNIRQQEGSFLEAQISLVTYEYSSPVINNKIEF